MYIHGYASTGNATKAQTLKAMFPDCNVVSPTFDYNNTPPDAIQQQIARLVAENDVRMMVGSSFGGYHALCATLAFEGIVWCINPVHDVIGTLHNILPTLSNEFFKERTAGLDASMLKSQQTKMLQAYAEFDHRVFQQLPRRERQLNFALSRHDEVLGDYTHLLNIFNNVDHVVWSETSTHHFEAFVELKESMAQTLAR